MNRSRNLFRSPVLWVTLLAVALTTSVALAGDDDRGSGNSKGRIQELESAVNSLGNRVEVQQQLIESLQSDIEGITGIFTPPSFVILDSVTIEEGQSVAVSVALSKPSVYQVMVDYSTVDGTAVAGQDYVAASDTLLFEPGTTVQEIVIQTIDNSSIGSPTRNFQILFGNPLYAELNASIIEAAIVDTQDKPYLWFNITETAYEPPIPPGYTSPTYFRISYTFVEGYQPSICHLGSISGRPYAPPETVRLRLVADTSWGGTYYPGAEPGVDFELPDYIEFPAGVHTGRIDFGAIIDDDLVEGDEYVWFWGRDAEIVGGDAAVNTRCSTQLRIVDADD